MIKKIRSIKPRIHLLVLIPVSIIMLVPLQKSEAQIVELDQKIFGMDCSPCAKGVEVRMERMDGVIGAELDLNRGEARLTFSDNHTTSLSQLHRSIVEGGFSPKEARIKVRGILHREGRQWILVTEAEDRFLLNRTDEGQFASEEGQRVMIEGSVAERDGQELWQLTVNQIHSAG